MVNPLYGFAQLGQRVRESLEQRTNTKGLDLNLLVQAAQLPKIGDGRHVSCALALTQAIAAPGSLLRVFVSCRGKTKVAAVEEVCSIVKLLCNLALHRQCLNETKTIAGLKSKDETVIELTNGSGIEVVLEHMHEAR